MYLKLATLDLQVWHMIHRSPLKQGAAQTETLMARSRHPNTRVSATLKPQLDQHASFAWTYEQVPTKNQGRGMEHNAKYKGHQNKCPEPWTLHFGMKAVAMGMKRSRFRLLTRVMVHIPSQWVQIRC